MSSVSNRYGLRRSGGRHGDVFTSPEVVSYMLDLVGYTADKDLRHISILEPACGEGEFVVEIIHRLKASSLRFGFGFEEAFLNNVFAYDIDGSKVARCRERISMLGYSFPVDANVLQADFLTENVRSFDVIVGNPPYVRYEQIPAALLSCYKQRYHTFHYRADLYILFFEKTLNQLNPGGHHCFICSNRWLKNEYGKKLRGWIAQNFRIESIISLEKSADAFQEDVLAYPAITLITNAGPGPSFPFIELNSIKQLGLIEGRQIRTPDSDDWSCVFNHLQNDDTLVTIEEMGFQIGVGVATGADSVFVSKDLPAMVEMELLLPALNAKDMSGNRLHWSGHYLLNPYKPNGDLINLEDYPRAAAYLLSHRETLQKRHTALKNPEKWYKTIDRIVPSLKNSPKVLLPDISGNQFIFVDDGNFYPQHNLYYVTGGSLLKLKLLGAMLMSDYVREQLLCITNCMNGGYPRWQSQYLRKLVMPDINLIEGVLGERLLEAYQSFDVARLNEIVREIVSLPRSRNYRHQPKVEQLTFEFSF
ncbi:MAG: Eco57I restriction-modification methylase domain-containing protein [Candidatus Cryptobacteroides sp.]